MWPATLLVGWISVNQVVLPQPVGTRGGHPLVLFPLPRPHILPVLDAIVVVLRPGAAVPAELRSAGEALGGRSWRLAAADQGL